jgi:hypothetical protein
MADDVPGDFKAKKKEVKANNEIITNQMNQFLTVTFSFQ